MNTKRKILVVGALAIAAGVLAGCGTAEKRYTQTIQDTNDRIERVKKAEADADAKLAEALTKVAEKSPEMAAMAISNVMLARALRAGGAGGVAQSFAVPQRPRDLLDYIEAGTRLFGAVGSVAVPIVGALEQGRTSRAGFARDVSIEHERQLGETGRIQSVAEIAAEVAARPPNTTTTTTYTFGRDGNVGSGTQQNDNHSQQCNAGTGAGGGAGGSGGSDAAGGAPGAAGGAGGNAC